MRCSNCGKEVRDNERFCPFCGNAVKAGENLNPTRHPSGVYGQSRNREMGIHTEQSMKWYKFIIYFQLFASAFLNFGNGMIYLMGFHYGTDNPALVYTYYGSGLKILDILMAVICIGLAVFAIVIRQKMAGFKKEAPTWLYILLGVQTGSNLFYMIAATVYTGINFIDSSTASSIGIGIGLLIVNYIYFNKRKALFQN